MLSWLVALIDARGLLTALLTVAVWLLYTRYHRHTHRRSLNGLTVLITGCDTGLGRHLALHLQSAGVLVYAACLTHRAVKQLTDLALPHFHPLQLDVTSDASAAAAVDFVTAHSHRSSLDCLINNAGVFDTFLCELTPLSSYKRCMDVNFLGTVRLTQHFAPLLRSGHGRLVTVGSFLGSLSGWSLSAYSASKWALEAWHDSVRGELAMFDVQCLLLQPGTMRTQLVTDVGNVYRRRWQTASEAVKADYGVEMLRVVPAVERIMALLSSDTSGVVCEVEQQLRRSRMDSRVRVGWDSWLCGLVRHLPVSDGMMDWLLSALVSMPTPAAVLRAATAVS